MNNLNDYTLFIKLCQMYIVSRYGTSVTVLYLDYNKYWRFAVIGKIY